MDTLASEAILVTSSSSILDQPVTTLAGVGPKRSALLGKLGIESMRDLLFHFPRDYEDRSSLAVIGAVCAGQTVTVQGEIIASRSIRLRGRQSIAEVTLGDDSGTIKATWFGRGFLARTLTPGTRCVLTGPVGQYKGLALKNPDYEILSGDEDDLLNTGRVVPIYRLTEGVTQRMLRRWVATALRALRDEGGAEGPLRLEETLPEQLLAKYDVPAIGEAMASLHFPEDMDRAQAARRRFIYEELLAIQLGVLTGRAKRLHEEQAMRHVTDGAHLCAFRDSLGFALTGSQAGSVADILEDMASPRPMARLLQGDVGCGKTVVALHAVAATADGGYQTALMVPTEILAEQHFAILHGALNHLGLRVEVLTGSTPDAAGLRQAIADGAVDVVVGTHALVQASTRFRNLGLVIIDEQHRFGVVQRSRLTEKGPKPDLLHMTATPIPRTLALTVYGGMDLSIIDELPPGRLPIKTRRVTPAKLDGLYDYVCQQARQGRQTYLICPLVEDSDKRDLKAVTTHYEELSAGPFAALRTELLHGRLGPADKEAVMQRFKRGEVDVLFSTTVIEVGIDVANATTIIIEDAAQFGLTQLHQLRGRVGRGTAESYCFLLGSPKTDDGRSRLEIMCRTSNGFEIAEEDLKLRGPGECRGLRQAGLSDLRVADLIRDARVLDHARRDAQNLLEQDPHLDAHCLAALRRAASAFAPLAS